MSWDFFFIEDCEFVDFGVDKNNLDKVFLNIRAKVFDGDGNPQNMEQPSMLQMEFTKEKYLEMIRGINAKTRKG